MAPQHGEAEEQLGLRLDKASPAQKQVLGLDNNCREEHPEKNHPGLTQAAGSHVAMPSPCWGCRDI